MGIEIGIAAMESSVDCSQKENKNIKKRSAIWSSYT